MKKYFGFASVEFYLVIALIGLVATIVIHRYMNLVAQTTRLSVEIVAQHFTTSVYNLHAQWLLLRNHEIQSAQVSTYNSAIQFSAQGWPLRLASVTRKENLVSLDDCVDLWRALLKNPPSIESSLNFVSDRPQYQASLSSDGVCRYRYSANSSFAFYFDYSPLTGQIRLYP